MLSTTDCIFCKIVNQDQSADILFETDDLVVIPDILPKAPVHLLIISKEHILSAHYLEEKHKSLAANMIMAANKAADQKGIGETGYKLMFNVGKEGGQIIPHLHLHVLGGKHMGE